MSGKETRASPLASPRWIPLWVRLGLPTVLIIGLAIGFVGFLNYFNYHTTYRELNVSRMMVVGVDLKQAVETGINFGLGPGGNAQLDKALFTAKQEIENLAFVAVTDETGRWIAGAGNSPDVNDWRIRLARIEKDTSWQSQDHDTYQIGLPFRNDFGLIAGAVVLGYHKDAIQRATASMRLALFGNWIIATALFGLAALLGVWRLTRNVEAELNEAKCALEPTPGSSAPILHLPLLGEEIEQGLPELLRQCREAERALAAAAGKGSL